MASLWIGLRRYASTPGVVPVETTIQPIIAEATIGYVSGPVFLYSLRYIENTDELADCCMIYA